uniref:Uncharacterized protein n=1 Tax=Timema bartmani TaxID=61472 RepID=A0A7R9EP27_9NEOP|nr:unnamed protein product [Timema bartmani]
MHGYKVLGDAFIEIYVLDLDSEIRDKKQLGLISARASGHEDKGVSLVLSGLTATGRRAQHPASPQEQTIRRSYAFIHSFHNDHNRDSNPDLPVVHSLVQHESDALDHTTTEAGGSGTLVPKKHHRSFDVIGQSVAMNDTPERNKVQLKKRRNHVVVDNAYDVSRPPPPLGKWGLVCGDRRKSHVFVLTALVNLTRTKQQQPNVQARHAFIFAIGPLPLAKRHTCPPIGRRYLPKFPERKGGGGKIHPSGLAKKNVAQDCWEEQKLRSAAMSSKFLLDSMLPKYHHQLYQHHQQQLLSSTPSATSAALFSDAVSSHSPSSASSSPQHTSSASASPGVSSARMYPYVSAAAAHHHHQQQQAVAAAAFGAAAASSSMVPGAFSSTSSAALAAAAAVDAAVTADKSCRYTAGLAAAANVPPPDSMVNYTLGHHHQNGTAVSAASSVSAASASMAAAAQFYHQAAAASAAADPLTSCSQPGSASAGQPIPDIPRYPWMSITGEWAPYSRQLGLG